MATNDGYTPYPLGLTALEVKTSILRAFNLTTELANYAGFNNGATAPTIVSGVKDGDFWNNPTTGISYRAYIDIVVPASPVLVFFEV